jgi:hypothetical protein
METENTKERRKTFDVITFVLLAWIVELSTNTIGLTLFSFNFLLSREFLRILCRFCSVQSVEISIKFIFM